MLGSRRMEPNDTAAVVGSMAEIEAVHDEAFKTIDGFKPGQTLRIGSLTAGDMIAWSEENAGSDEAKRQAGLRLICKSLVDASGVRYASQNDTKNIQTFSRLAHKTTERVVRDILAFNGMTPKGDRPKAEVDAKNG
jgi:hypothetical protein